MSGECTHPPESVTWQNKSGGKVAIIDGYLHGECDMCGQEVVAPARFRL